MKKIFLFASIALLAACNSKNNEPAKSGSDSTGTTMQMKDIMSPYPVVYSSKFAMDDPKNAETLLNLWKVWDAGDLSKAKDMFADSVVMYLADGSMMNGKSDSILAATQTYRNSLGTSTSSVDAIMAVKSTDKNEHWALIWGTERDSNKGKVDSFRLQETWRFNNDGKADMMFQYRAAAAPPKMMKK